MTTTDPRPQAGAMSDGSHGAPRLSLLGSPLHPILSDYPATFMTTAPLFDVLGYASRSPQLRGAGFAVGVAGVLSALPAAAAGLLDYRRVGEHHPGKSMARTHGLLNTAALGAQVASLWMRRRDVSRPSIASTALSLASAGIAGVSAHLGGELVYQHGFRVDATEDERRSGP